jgi:hypothetical protein
LVAVPTAVHELSAHGPRRREDLEKPTFSYPSGAYVSHLPVRLQKEKRRLMTGDGGCAVWIEVLGGPPPRGAVVKSDIKDKNKTKFRAVSPPEIRSVNATIGPMATFR